MIHPHRCAALALATAVLVTGCRSADDVATAPRPLAPAGLAERLHQIFATDELTPRAFGPARWLDAASYCTVEASSTLAGGQDLVRYDAASGTRSVLVAAERLVPAGASAALALEDYAFSDDGARLLVFTNTRKVWRDNTRGDYWVLTLDSGALTQLGGDVAAASLLFAKLSPDGARAGYVHANDLWVQDLASGAITRLTHDGSATTINGTSDWVYEEELGVRDAWRWSPDGRSIAFWHFDSSGVPLYTLVDTVSTLYPTLTTIPYPKAGQTNSVVKLGVIDAAAGGEPRWVDLPGDPREHYVARMEWIPATDALLVQQLDRRQQRATVWRVDATSMQTRELFTETSAAWIDVQDGWRWLPSGELLWTSERDGWRHAWAFSPDGRWRCLTPGEYDLTEIAGVDGARGHLYFIASPEDATARALCRVPLSGGAGGAGGAAAPERVTPSDWGGTHAYDVAPGGAFALHTASALERPPFVELVRLPDHAPLAVLEKNAEVAARVADFAVQPTEFFRLEIEPDVELDGWMMRPRRFDPSRRYPLLMHVYNEPSAVQANDVWRGVRGLYHRALAEAGYVVVCVDSQGTPGPRGVAWRKSTYGRFGTVGAAQQAAAVRALVARHRWLDPARVAVWGWSGGGTMTLNLMFRHPETYAVGMAVAPVPDIALYDSIYQERYTGLLPEDAAAYRENSPITYAEGLAGELLIVHGSGDDNVHMQGTERLIDRLIALGKPFEFMLYPNRSHALKEGPGTLHHVYAHLARYLVEHLPPGAR
jgi:dipeptidyl-peptidase-4